MIKIDEYGFLPSQKYQGKTRKFKRKGLSSFLMKMESATEDTLITSFPEGEQNLILEEYLNEITENGERLKERISKENLYQYKKSIRSFFKMVCSNAFETKEKVSASNTLFQKKYITIRIIDEKLNKLALSILQNQVNQLDILDKLEEIKGLLVNLLQ